AVTQDWGAVALTGGGGAIDAVMAGDIRTAVAKLKAEWVSLPGLGMARATAVFERYGGRPGGVLPTSQQEPQPAQAQPSKGGSMPVFALLGLIAQYIPQIVSLIKPDSKSAARD